MTASNDGMVKVWSISLQPKEEIKTKLVASIDTKCRVTCMIVHKVPPVAQHQEDNKSGMVSNKNPRLKMDKSHVFFCLSFALLDVSLLLRLHARSNLPIKSTHEPLKKSFNGLV